LGLEDDAATGAGTGLLLDGRDQCGAGRKGRHHQPAELGRVPRSGEQIEQFAHIGTDDRVGGEQADVLIGAGRVGVVVSASDVAVPADLVPLTPHDELDLRMGLEPDQPVDDLYARLFEGTGPGDVGLLIEAGLERSEERRAGKECRSRWSPYY